MKKETIYKNQFLEVDYEEENNLVVSYWAPTTGQMTLSQYKDCMKDLADLYQKNADYTKSLVIMKDFNFPVEPELQAWGNSLFDGVEIEKTALIVPSDFIAGLSVKQSIEDLDKGAKIQYFDDEEKAREWLVEETSV